MIAGLIPFNCCVVTPFSVATPTSNPLLEKARKKNTTAYARKIRAPKTISAAPLCKACSLDIGSFRRRTAERNPRHSQRIRRMGILDDRLFGPEAYGAAGRGGLLGALPPWLF